MKETLVPLTGTAYSLRRLLERKETGILTRQKRFSLDPYTPLVEQCEARLTKYGAQERGAPPEQIASAIADLLDQSHPPRRILVGAQAEKLLARLGGRITSRLTRLGLKW